jgi:hypothetical protein
MMTAKISVSQVEDAARRYWRILMEKLGSEMTGFYAYDAMVFNPFSARMEPGRVSAARKEREYFTPQTKFRAEIIGPINVQLLSDTIAVAMYQFHWEASNMEQKILGKKFDKAVRDGRATQVFSINSDGKLLIVSEHLSDIWRDEKNDGRDVNPGARRTSAL